MTSKLTGKLVASDDPSGVLRFVADMPQARRRKPKTILIDEAPPPVIDDVERVELLVKASDYAREPRPRRVFVETPMGVKETTQGEVLSKLLDKEEIRNEPVSGRRAKVKRCACGVVFEQPKTGPTREACRSCRGLVCECGADKDHSARWCRLCGLLPEHVAERMRAWADGGRMALANLTPEQRSERVRKNRAALTPEQRSEALRKVNASLTPEQRSERSRKANAGMTPERRAEKATKCSESISKAWEARRAKAAAKEPKQ